MDIINRKELESLLNNLENQEIKDKISDFLQSDEVDIESFFVSIKELSLINDTDYNIILLLEEFYLRFKDIEKKNVV